MLRSSEEGDPELAKLDSVSSILLMFYNYANLRLQLLFQSMLLSNHHSNSAHQNSQAGTKRKVDPFSESSFTANLLIGKQQLCSEHV